MRKVPSTNGRFKVGAWHAFLKQCDRSGQRARAIVILERWEGSCAVSSRHPVPVVFSYWRFDAGEGQPAMQRRQIVDEIIVPVFSDPRLRADVACIYARKHTVNKPEDIMTPSLEPCDEVRLYIATQTTNRAKIAQLVAQQVPEGRRVSGPLEYRAKDRACLPDCAWYRRGLTDVAAVALDLHSSPLLETHRRHLRALYGQGGLRGFARASLHAYLLEHAARYPGSDEAREVFWRDLLRWGPAPNLFPPGHLLANLILVV